MGIDLVADLEVAGRCLDDAGHVLAECDRQVGVADARIAAPADLVVDRIDAGGGDLDAQLAAVGGRPVDLIQLQDFGTAEAVDADGLHVKLPGGGSTHNWPRGAGFLGCAMKNYPPALTGEPGRARLRGGRGPRRRRCGLEEAVVPGEGGDVGFRQHAGAAPGADGRAAGRGVAQRRGGRPAGR